ncbi:hypothetical protein [Aquimarina longa]|uniref:hypothetical protein n=1 Tax=Aquimarina longa TaxID=1080221 RepID=UPI0011DF4DDA|nr:hypothetical protein [Aquimarina longa]
MLLIITLMVLLPLSSYAQENKSPIYTCLEETLGYKSSRLKSLENVLIDKKLLNDKSTLTYKNLYLVPTLDIYQLMFKGFEEDEILKIYEKELPITVDKIIAFENCIYKKITIIKQDSIQKKIDLATTQLYKKMREELRNTSENIKSLTPIEKLKKIQIMWDKIVEDNLFEGEDIKMLLHLDIYRHFNSKKIEEQKRSNKESSINNMEIEESVPPTPEQENH